MAVTPKDLERFGQVHAGIATTEDLLYLIRHPKAGEKWLAEYGAIRDSIVQAVTDLTEGEEIEKLKRTAQEDRSAAAAELSNAKTEAERLVADATRKAAAITSESGNQVEENGRAIQAARDDLQLQRNELTTAQDELAVAQSELAEAREKLQRDQNAHTRAVEDFERTVRETREALAPA